MSVTKIYIDTEGSTQALAVENYITQLATELSTYGFTVTYVDNNIFYITANIIGLNTLYYTFRSDSNRSYTVNLRKSIPTTLDYNNQYGITTVNYGYIYAYGNRIDAQSQTVYYASGCVYVVQNSNGDVLIAFSDRDTGTVRLPTNFIGLTTVTTAQNGRIQAYYYSGPSLANYILLPKNDKEGVFTLSYNSPGVYDIGTNSILINNTWFANQSSANYTGGNAGYGNSFYRVGYITISLAQGQIYIIDGNQYLWIGYLFLKL